jgi:hypothetical protein
LFFAYDSSGKNRGKNVDENHPQKEIKGDVYEIQVAIIIEKKLRGGESQADQKTAKYYRSSFFYVAKSFINHGVFGNFFNQRGSYQKKAESGEKKSLLFFRKKQGKGEFKKQSEKRGQNSQKK